MSSCIICRVAKPSQVYFTGEVKGESAMKLATDVGSPIDYEFRVTMRFPNIKPNIVEGMLYIHNTSFDCMSISLIAF